jgi:hypothetical protein
MGNSGSFFIEQEQKYSKKYKRITQTLIVIKYNIDAIFLEKFYFESKFLENYPV